MKTNYSLSIIAYTMLVIAACSKHENGNNNGPGSDTTNINTGSPVETNRPNTNYTPAFAGQTRVNGVRTTTSIQTKMIASALVAPWGIVNLPDGRFLITERAGQMRIVTTSGNVSAPITGMPSVNSAGQGGLLDICIDPNFASNRIVYWTFVRTVTGGNAIAVGRGRLSSNETAVESPAVIYSSTTPAPATSNYGSRIMFDATGNLLVTFGDRTDVNVRTESQSVRSSIGKVIRITTNGTAATSNPAFSQAGALPELYSFGHRNPQGLAIHPVTGDIWECEHGPRGGDEVNRLQPGANYGWPVISYGIEYSGQPLGAGIQQQAGMQQPVYYWDPVVSPSGMTFYTGNKVPEWQNNLFLCSLTQTHLIRLVIENNRVIGEERLLASENQRFRDIIQGNDNALYAITDAGRLYRIDRQ